jgi:hypothetical protein
MVAKGSRGSKGSKKIVRKTIMRGGDMNPFVDTSFSQNQRIHEWLTIFDATLATLLPLLRKRLILHLWDSQKKGSNRLATLCYPSCLRREAPEWRNP